MSGTSDLWLIEYEAACDRYATGRLKEVEFVGELRRLGMDNDTIADHLDVIQPQAEEGTTL